MQINREKNMKFNIKYFNKTPFYLAVEKENIEIIKLLLTKDNYDVNIPCILNLI